MNNFLRAFWAATRHWPRILLAFLASAAAAGLWGANIATLFPILEVSLRGEAPQAWNERRIKEMQDRIAQLEKELQGPSRPADPAAAQRFDVDRRLQIQAEQVRLAGAEKLQPYIARYAPSDAFRFLLVIVAWMFCATALKQVLQVLAGMSVARVSQDVTRDLRHRVFDKMLEMDRSTFLAQGPGGFSVQLTNTCEMLANGLQSVFGGAMSEPLKLLVCLIGAAFISWRLLLVSMLFCPIASLAVVFLNRQLRTVAKSTLERSHSLYHIMHETLQNMATVQIFSMEGQERLRFQQSTRQMRQLALRAALYNGLVSPVSEMLAISVVCLAITVGAALFIRQDPTVFGITFHHPPLGVSGLMVFLALLLGGTDPLRRLSGVIAGINCGMVAADVLYPMLDRQPQTADPAEPQTPPRPHRVLALSKVTFAYQHKHPILRNANLTIPFGQTVAFVGANGTGKSTLVNLLCRFWDPQHGRLTLDGIALKDMTRAELRSRIAVVTQHTELFNESLLYNIRYGRWDASEEEIIRAATLARAHEFIVTFPDEYQTKAGPNGMRLSGGQRQRIALARALLRNPEILILDEATSQIDVESERLIHEALHSFKGSRTILLITHRQSALSLADRVVQLAGGGFEELPGSGGYKAA